MLLLCFIVLFVYIDYTFFYEIESNQFRVFIYQVLVQKNKNNYFIHLYVYGTLKNVSNKMIDDLLVFVVIYTFFIAIL